MMTLHKWRKTWRLPGEGVPSAEREPEGWKRRRQIHGGAGERRHQRYRAQRLLPRAGPIPGAGEPLAAGGPYLGHRPSVPEALDANAKPVLTMAEQKELEKLRAQDQREIKAL